MFIDVHTHINDDDGAVRSVHAHDFISNNFPEKQFFTTGIHPWFGNTEIVESFILKLKGFKGRNLIGIGECGLDRIKGTDIENQKKIFEQQLVLAEKLHLPVVIHQVKTISDIFPFLKKHKELPYIFHAYNGNVTQTRQLLDFNVWFSFGNVLHKMAEKIEKSLEIIPLDRLFLETDESNVSINSLYEKMAIIKDVKPGVLLSQINRNFEVVFKRRFDELD
jgi:TatD DNase family protein